MATLRARAPVRLDFCLPSEGKPVAARVYILHESGKTHQGPPTATYSQGGEQHSAADRLER